MVQEAVHCEQRKKAWSKMENQSTEEGLLQVGQRQKDGQATDLSLLPKSAPLDSGVSLRF